ncbi:TIGR04222 domain-containing membrane protein [Amycolatopsis thermalba]|uniref:TIGR04222 domain-containing membrane protein n=1 Tax=Amycolatopsis thermalba TaxID=944492 RepID=A0ABY4P1H6_9PSEU|nr:MULTISPECIES: TIGR04222 domain-containing membrane protein [Amycolatopsis]UQS26102.1 TIGR04222 domain-containing membrane protein [Amycolatopsis thermalba]
MGAFWGLSARELVVLYTALILVPPVVRLLGPVLLRCRRIRIGTEPVTAVELAVLSGGPERAVDVVLAGLVARRWIRVDGAGRLTTTTQQAPADPLAVAVMLAVSFWRGLATAQTLRVHLVAGTPFEQVVDGLVARGLVVAPGDAAGIRIASRVLLIGVVASTFAGGYAMAAIPVMLAGVLVLGLAELVPPPRRTVAGARLLRRVARQPGTAAAYRSSNRQRARGGLGGGWGGDPFSR